MLNLTQIGLLAVVGHDNPEYLKRVLRVLRWCDSLARWGPKILLSVPSVPETDLPNLEVVQIPPLPDKAQWEIFMARTAPVFSHNFVMQIHEDGFPTHPELWEREFMTYDYIGAPWHDDVVGSGGMSLTSYFLLRQILRLPWYAGDGNADEWLCRRQRVTLEGKGIRFAPPEVAHRYCTESMRKDQPSFGFHGRRDCAEKYAAAWAKIEAWEQEQGA